MTAEPESPPPPQARWYETLGQHVQCRLCPHACLIPPDAWGRCRARRNDDGVLRAMAYGRLTAEQLDPMEKKPLYHFLPGRPVLSIGSFGCNLRCRFCQNHMISQRRADDASLTLLSPDALADAMREHHAPAVAYTYNEPLINAEYLADATRAVRRAGGKNVLVTNGYVNPGPLDELLPHVDAMNIDVKSFEDAFYRAQCGGELAHVLATVQRAVRATHVELTLLVIPGANDAPKPNEDFARWIVDHAGADTPLHLSAYFPRYQYAVGPTQPVMLERLREIYVRHLRYVYLGNVRQSPFADTHCPRCDAIAVRRPDFGVVDTSGLAPVPGAATAACAACGESLPIRLA